MSKLNEWVNVTVHRLDVVRGIIVIPDRPEKRQIFRKRQHKIQYKTYGPICSILKETTTRVFVPTNGT